MAARRSKVLLWIGGTLLLVLVLYGAGGWYFSGQLIADALEVDYPGTAYNLEFTAVEPDRVTLSDSDEEDRELRTAGIFGLQWAGGYGQVADIVATEGDEVTRAFTLLDGDPPSVGTEADVTRYAFPVAPDTAFGVQPSDVEYESPLGPMEAWFVPGTGDTWGIVVHGKGAARTETLRLVKQFVDAGLPVLAIAYRNDPGQPLDPSGHYRYGATEWEDLQGAVRHAAGQGASKVVLAGLSTGSAVIASFMERSDHAGMVAGIIHEGPNLDLEEAIYREAAKRSLPGIGLPVPRSLVWTAERITELRTETDFSELDYVDEAREIDVPQLVLHGTDDSRVPVEVGRRLAEGARDVTLVEFPGGEHIEAWNVDRERYELAVRQFVDEVAGASAGPAAGLPASGEAPPPGAEGRPPTG